jgi:hypothetical protein
LPLISAEIILAQETTINKATLNRPISLFILLKFYFVQIETILLGDNPASTPTKQPNISYNLKPSVKKTFHSKTRMKNKTNKQTQQETKTFEPYKKNHSLRKNKVLTATAN